MAICLPNFNPLAFTIPEIQPLKLLCLEICNLQYGASFAHSDAILDLMDSHRQGLPVCKICAFYPPTV